MPTQMKPRIHGSQIRRLLNVCFSLIVVLFAHTMVHAQTASTGAIRGNVVDATGAAMSGVNVEAVSTATGIERKGITESGGTYTLGLLPPGSYNLRFSFPGFETAAPPPVEVSVAGTITVNITMVVGAQQQTVEISAAAPIIQAESATLGTTVGG